MNYFVGVLCLCVAGSKLGHICNQVEQTKTSAIFLKEKRDGEINRLSDRIVQPYTSTFSLLFHFLSRDGQVGT